MAIAQLLAQILVAQYGRDVRQSIHDAIEECYSDVSASKTLAEDATLGANTAADNANDSVISGVVVFGDDLVFQNAGGGTVVADNAMKGVHDATTLANEKAGLANTKAGLAQSAADAANAAAAQVASFGLSVVNGQLCIAVERT